MSSSHGEDRDSTKAGLKAWWANFTKSSKTLNLKERKVQHDRVFGEPLRTSLKYASVAISIAGEDGNQYVWGYVPIIVAKVGLYLKEHATEVEGVFRIAGSQKRMRELQETFDVGPKYGKNVVWERYSVHDAASVLRRYLNQMPEPIVPLDLYSEFRNVMYKQPLDVEAAIRTYRLLIQSMPSANRYLLLYVLDLLAVFARKSQINLMPASNLAMIFQPGIFSHPSHLQDANEHKLATEVLEFLIEHQDNFLIRLSQPPTTNIESLTLSISVPQPDQARPDVADLSESDEELGELTMHEGGGAKLARRSTSAGAGPSFKKSGGLFKSRRNAAMSSKAIADEPSPEAGPSTMPIAETTSLGLPATSEGSHSSHEQKRTPSPRGEILELELTQSLPGNVNLRRSRTVPSRRSQDERAEEKRSVSGGKTKVKRDVDELKAVGAEVTSAATSPSIDSVTTDTRPSPPIANDVEKRIDTTETPTV